MQMSYHAPIGLMEYLNLSLRDRFSLHASLADFVEEMNEEGPDEGEEMGGFPRAVRRGF